MNMYDEALIDHETPTELLTPPMEMSVDLREDQPIKQDQLIEQKQPIEQEQPGQHPPLAYDLLLQQELV